MKKTPCEVLGYKVGGKFKVVSQYGRFHVGDIIELVEDDHTSCPVFSDNKGNTHFMYLDTEVKPYVEGKGEVSEENNMISFPCPEGYVFDGVRKLHKGDFRFVLGTAGLEVGEWDFDTETFPDNGDDTKIWKRVN